MSVKMDEKITKYFRLSLSDTSKREKTFSDTSDAKPVKKIEFIANQTSSKISPSLEDCMRLGTDNIAPIAMFIIEKALRNKWPWMRVIAGNDDEKLLQVTFSSEKLSDFDRLVSDNKIEKFIKSTLGDLESDLEGVIGEELHSMHGSKVVQLMSGVSLESFRSVESKVSNLLSSTLKIQFANFKPGQVDVLQTVGDADLVKNALNLLGPEGKETMHINKCLDDDAFKTIRIALFLAASSIRKKWPWIKISKVKRRNILLISIEAKYDVMFSKLIEGNKIEDHVKDDFEFLNANLMGIIGSPVYIKLGEDICQLLQGVRVKSLKGIRNHRSSECSVSRECIHLSIEETGEEASPAEELMLVSSTEINSVTEVATSDVKAEPIAFERVLRSENQAALAISLASRSLTAEWPWIETTSVIEGNKLCINVPKEKEEELHMLINEGKLFNRINHYFENLESELDQILQDETCEKLGPEIVSRMRNISVTKVDRVGPDNCCTANKYMDGQGGGIQNLYSKNTVNIAKSDDSHGGITSNIVAKGGNITNITEENVVNMAGNFTDKDIDAVARLIKEVKQ